MQIVPKFTEGLATEFVKYTLSYTDFSVAAANNTINLMLIPPKGYYIQGIIKPTASFEGGGATYVNITVGSPTVGASGLISGGDILAAPADTAFYQGGGGNGTPELLRLFSFGASEQVTVGLDSDVNLDTLTQGAVDIYLKFGQLPQEQSA